MTQRTPPSADATALRLTLASPDEILSWSHGEVVTGDTINYRTGRPVNGGLFCERIFGPERDWACGCGRLRGIRHAGVTCEQCKVTVGNSRGRRERFGHIELAVPVVHTWFFRLRPSPLALLLGIPRAELERIVYQELHVVTDPGDTGIAQDARLDDAALARLTEKQGTFSTATGAEAIAHLLGRLNLDTLATDLRRQFHATTAVQRRQALRTRLEVVESLRDGVNQPHWMILRRIPVLPPDLRPVLRLDSGQYASSDLNELYRRILHRNTRLRKLLDLNAPAVILRNERRLLQQAVDALFDNAHLTQPVLGVTRRPLRSLSDSLGGKKGRLRGNLLGKRVDYSGRAVIVVGPELKLDQVGLPREMALTLLEPRVLGGLIDRDLASNLHTARKRLARRDPVVWDVLADVLRERPMLLNRAPTLHRFNVQAFEPVLVEGNALRLPPLVCKGFNADFDGDTMAVHVPLSTAAIREARQRMMPSGNVFSPAAGQPMLTPSKDIVLGCHHLTINGAGPVRGTYHSTEEVERAHDAGVVKLHDRIRLRLPAELPVVREGRAEVLKDRRIETTVGRALFHALLPEGMPFHDLTLTAGALGRIIAACHEQHGRKETVDLLERIQKVGFRTATRAGLSISLTDLPSLPEKDSILAEARATVERVEDRHAIGDLTEEDRHKAVVETWRNATRRVRDGLMARLGREDRLNPVHEMIASGARGNAEQLGQLAGMRGLMARPSGEVVETPITSSFREGLRVLEYFHSTHGTRKGQTDTALKTAEAGHLTRKLIDVAQGVLVVEEDCGSKDGVVRKEQPGYTLTDLAAGRVTARAIRHPETEKVLVKVNTLLDTGTLRSLEEAGVKRVVVRSPMTCRSAGQGHGAVCRRCYGADRSTGELVKVGTAVGILAAQSISEPATQLTMRTFHTGGVHTEADITTGLPRVRALFEAHRSRRPATLAATDGVVRVGTAEERRRGRDVVFIRREDGTEVLHVLAPGRRLRVGEGQRVRAGARLTDGPVCPHELLRSCGRARVQRWLVGQVAAVYRTQGIEVDDKHIELIVARMLSRVKVLDGGGTDLLPGAVVEEIRLGATNAGLPKDRQAKATPILLGVSQAALRAGGFLSAASFQDTTRVLARAALAGTSDPLAGLKENVLLGRLIPAGTGA